MAVGKVASKVFRYGSRGMRRKKIAYLRGVQEYQRGISKGAAKALTKPGQSDEVTDKLFKGRRKADNKEVRDYFTPKKKRN